MPPLDLGPISALQSSLRHVVQLKPQDAGKDQLSVVIFRFDDVPPAVEEAGQPDGQRWYSMQSECPHLSFPLEQGTIEIEDSDIFVVCPYHSYDFSLTSGCSTSQSDLKACVWPMYTREADQHLLIDLHEPFDLLSIRPVNPQFAASAPQPSVPSLSSLSLEEPKTVTEWIHRIMSEPSPPAKVASTRALVQQFRSGKCTRIGNTLPPEAPARESSLKSVDPGLVSKRGKGGSEKSRIAILHALANIELYAIDLALDVLARFPAYQGKRMPLAYFSDFLKVAEDEAKHFTLLCERLEALGSYFGALPVHSGLWASATQTREELLERIAIVNLVHESRGLDTNPGQIQKFKNAGDKGSEEVLTTIHHDEVTHVATGHRWLMFLCTERHSPPLDPVQIFRQAVAKHFFGSLKPPFNADDRRKAGLTPDYYENMQGRPSEKQTKKPLNNAAAGG